MPRVKLPSPLYFIGVGLDPLSSLAPHILEVNKLLLFSWQCIDPGWDCGCQCRRRYVSVPTLLSDRLPLNPTTTEPTLTQPSSSVTLSGVFFFFSLKETTTLFFTQGFCILYNELKRKVAEFASFLIFQVKRALEV